VLVIGVGAVEGDGVAAAGVPLSFPLFIHSWLQRWWASRVWAVEQMGQVGVVSLQRRAAWPNLQDLWHWVIREAENIVWYVRGQD